MNFNRPGWNAHPHVKTGTDLSLGERAADKVRNGMGSWKFIWIQTGLVLLWVAGNLFLLSQPFDPYPFILLNLLFSVQAAYASPIILLSQRRADAQSSEIAIHTYENGQEILSVNNKQTAILDQQTEMLIAIQALREAIEDGPK